jgi:hypothetical protein
MIRRFIFLLCCAVALRAADTIAVNNAAFLAGQSPENWTNSGSSYALTINEGAYFKLNFTGTSFALNVDLSALNGYGAGYYPTLKWQVDGGTAVRRQCLSSDTSISISTGLADATHSLVVWLDGMDESTNTNRWAAGLSGLKITGLVVDTGKTITAATNYTRNMIVFSDSIGSGSVALGSVSGGNYSIVQSASIGWAALLAANYQLEYCNVSFCGQGFETGIQGVPAVTSSYNLKMSGVSRTFSTSYSIAIVQFGTNGGLSAGSVLQGLLENIRTALGTATKIYLIQPLNQNAVATIAAGYASYVAAHPTDTNIAKIDLGSTGASLVTDNSYDGVHPNAAGYALIASAYAAQIPRPGGTATATSLTATSMIFAP